MLGAIAIEVVLRHRRRPVVHADLLVEFVGDAVIGAAFRLHMPLDRLSHIFRGHLGGLVVGESGDAGGQAAGEGMSEGLQGIVIPIAESDGDPVGAAGYRAPE